MGAGNSLGGETPADTTAAAAGSAATASIEAQLREREERLRAILNTALDAIITIDRNGIITSINPATTRLFQYRPDELIGHNVSMLMPPPHREQHDSYIARYLETGKAHVIGTGREVSAVRKDGTVFPIDLAISEVDHLQLFTGIIRDKAERKALERDVLRIAEEEDRRIGHELHDGIQQEVAAMAMFAGSLLKALDSADPIEVAGRKHRLFDQDSFTNIRRIAGKILAGLSDAQRHVQRLARGIVPLQIDSQGLCNALATLASATDAYEDLGCRFEADAGAAIDDSMVATHLYRIAQEAVNNAIRHSRATEIVIAMRDVDGRLVLEISDDGIGLDTTPSPGPELTSRSNGIGIRAMHYRASLIGAVLELLPGEQQGTIVRCSLTPT